MNKYNQIIEYKTCKHGIMLKYTKICARKLKEFIPLLPNPMNHNQIRNTNQKYLLRFPEHQYALINIQLMLILMQK